jgi:pseudouridine kinase
VNKGIVIIGGADVDYLAQSDEKIIPEVSNIGKVFKSYGGVGFNIATNLGMLKDEVYFISAFNGDNDGDSQIKFLKRHGVKVIAKRSSLPSASYVAVNDNGGELIASICDNRIIEEVDSVLIDQYGKLLKEAEYIVLDGNIEEKLIDYIFAKYSDKRIVVDPISPQKIEKFRRHISDMYLLKCNKKQAKHFFATDEKNSETLLHEFYELGAKRVVLSDGAEPTYFLDLGSIGLLSNKTYKDYVNSSGAGDAQTSGIIDGLLKGLNLKKAIKFGNILAKVTLFSNSSTSEEVRKFAYKKSS